MRRWPPERAATVHDRWRACQSPPGVIGRRICAQTEAAERGGQPSWQDPVPLRDRPPVQPALHAPRAGALYGETGRFRSRILGRAAGPFVRASLAGAFSSTLDAVSGRKTHYLCANIVLLAGWMLPASVTAQECRRLCLPDEVRDGESGCCAAGSTGAEASVGCPAGRTRSLDTDGHCCWPGQAWGRDRCRGIPTSCPSGYATDAGEGCSLGPCDDGRERAVDGVTCCWPGQEAIGGTCRGVPSSCPELSRVDGETCTATQAAVRFECPVPGTEVTSEGGASIACGAWLRVAPGTSSFTAEAPGRTPVGVTVDQFAGERITIALDDTWLRPLRRLHVTVAELRDGPIPSISVDGITREREWLEPEWNAGMHAVVVSAPGYEPRSLTCDNAHDPSGCVIDIALERVARLTVRLTSSSRGEVWVLQVDEDGERLGTDCRILPGDPCTVLGVPRRVRIAYEDRERHDTDEDVHFDDVAADVRLDLAFDVDWQPNVLATTWGVLGPAVVGGGATLVSWLVLHDDRDPGADLAVPIGVVATAAVAALIGALVGTQVGDWSQALRYEVDDGATPRDER